ncbi:MAG: DEAD/DEAH box helicase family protein [Rhodospirillaceae bacterium]|nr:DEAD/DEAH box helicase family protein [Rhodospirillaceae bacterium]
MIGQTLSIPTVAVQETTPIGQIAHVVASGGSFTVDNEEDIRVSQRVTEKLLGISDGRRLVISHRRIQDPPAAVDGVLQETDDGLRWVYNRSSSDVSARAKADGWLSVAAGIRQTWSGVFRFVAAASDGDSGLRPPQLGALHALGAHWSLSRTRPATVVMPTGTGKTETIIAMLVAFLTGPLVVAVPSRVLREQTAEKFRTLGILRSLGVIPEEVRNPVVGVVRKRPRTVHDWEPFAGCHVIVGTIGVLAQGTAAAFVPTLAGASEVLVVDEAHHLPADSWATFRDYFRSRPVVQLTATPFRRDGMLVDGDVIYEYPLKTAQENGYFKRISFEPVFEVDPDDGDRAIAEAAVSRLREDVAAGLDHILMARCRSISRAEGIIRIYTELAGDLAPALIHSEVEDTSIVLEKLRLGHIRIVVCVDMFGEGFDLPQLKIAALHDVHKSLGVVLQFTGRFTRSAGVSIGDATVIANIANEGVSVALERLYSEDADWNRLLSEYSSEAVRAHRALVEFLRDSDPIVDQQDDRALEISPHLLRPRFSTVVYRAERFRPARFVTGLSGRCHVYRHWFHRDSNTLYFVVMSEPEPEWTRSHDLLDRQWDLFVVSFSAEQRLLYIHASDKSSVHEELAKAVTEDTAGLIKGDVVFRSLGKINRLRFQNIGLKKRGRRNLRYAMYTGADVALALSQSERAGSEKSNLSGDGWEGGAFATIGCSYKGRIWSRERGTIPEFVEWAQGIGTKLLDNQIDTATILRNVLVPEELTDLPDTTILAIEWPIEFLRQMEERIVLHRNGREWPLSAVSIVPAAAEATEGRIEFKVVSDDVEERLALSLDTERGFVVTHVAGATFQLAMGRIRAELADVLSEYPPLVRFVDMSELDGNLRVAPKDAQVPELPSSHFDEWEWNGIDITKESLWIGEEERTDSIQARAADRFRNGGFEVVFDDDSPGEPADLICMKEEDELIRLALVHCKYSSSAAPGGRIRDVVEVASQAVRSSKWQWRFKELCRHVAVRERRLRKPYRNSRFIVGSTRAVNKFSSLSRFKPVRAEIVIVQPGIQREHLSADQSAVLAAACSFLKETVDVDLAIICQ